MAWRLAKSLAVLYAEADRVAPNRSRTYDGTIGDLAHAARASAHNPNSAGVVCAGDITNDPAGGMDCASLFEFLRTHPHPDLRYIIHRRKVARRSHGWAVEMYTGPNPHTTHIHVCVGGGTDAEPTPPYDHTDSWRLQEWRGEDMPIDTVSEAAAKAAVQKLVAAGIVTKPEAHKLTDAASVGLLWVVIARLLERQS